MSYCVHKAKTMFDDVTVTVTFDLKFPKFNNFTLESEWKFVLNLNKFPKGVTEILCSRELDGWNMNTFMEKPAV